MTTVTSRPARAGAAAADPSWDPYVRGCPSREVLDRIGDTWTVLVLGVLGRGGAHRFTAVRRGVDGISEKMLTQTLRSLERDGLVVRTVHAEVPPRVDYELTDLGRTLLEPLGALQRWSVGHMGEVVAARARYAAAASGS